MPAVSLSSRSTPCIRRGQRKASRVFYYRFRDFAQSGMQLRSSLQHSSRSNSILVCRASGGVLGGLKKALQGKSKPKPSADIIEFPPCRLLKQTDDYELRMYDVYPFVTTPYERRDEGYLALGSYMEGRNADSAKMNLTQPIMMRYEPVTGLKTMQLYVGSKQGDPPASQLSKPEPLQHPPLPVDTFVSLEVGGGEVVAVRAFQGQATESNTQQQRLHLIKALELDGITLGLAERAGMFRLAQYGPINSLSVRKNEVILTVQL
ncbi:TPA: hypothetical protein ACH3X2_000752 [Trebouxia sp. C0005]|nr:MAG: hypothetical protein FRX49_11662 [Trebouxia sp. A1-2]